MIIVKNTYARAGLIGNPSDGYFGKTISFSIRNFRAQVVLYESPQLEIKLHHNDQLIFNSIDTKELLITSSFSLKFFSYSEAIF